MAEHMTGRTTSWVAVLVIVIGFIVGGIGLIVGPSWPLFWVGAGVAIIGGIFALATGIMDDYGVH